jgi:hypothetical protein
VTQKPAAGLLAFIVALGTVTDASADKTDVVEFGQSRMVGEVKRLDRGKLYFKTDATDTIAIDWAEVTRLVSSETMRIERRDGSYRIGTFVDGAPPHMLAVTTGGETIAARMEDVVAFEQMEAEFWDRLDIKTSIGYSNSNSNDVEQFNFDAKFSYDTENRERELGISTQRSASDGNESTTRRTLDYQTLRFRDSRWYTGWLASYEDNDALDLDYRFGVGAIVGQERYPNANRRYRAFVGLGAIEELFAGGDANASLEGVFGASVDWFRFSTPELDLSSSLILFPSITEWGRLRSRFNIDLTWEIVEDLYWQLSFYDDFDSEPLDENGDPAPSRNDYGITASVGWSW